MENMSVENLTNGGNFWFSSAASEYARKFDFFHDVVTYISIFWFFALVGTALYFTFKYRERKGNLVAKKQVTMKLRKKVLHAGAMLEITWITIPFLLVMVMFAWGFKGYLESQVEPHDTLEIKVIAQKWSWVFEYPDGLQSPAELIIPEGRAVKLLMTSKDVIHSFFIPNFRLKRDVIPYRYSSIIVKPERKGKFQVFCTEYCGEQHSTMLATMTVTTEDEYHNFLQGLRDQAGIPPVELGEKLYAAYSCNACHTLDGTTSLGPSWQGLFGKTRKLEAGEDKVADENYLRTSIVSPSTDIVNGYANIMPSFGYLTDTQIEALVAYIKTLE